MKRRSLLPLVVVLSLVSGAIGHAAVDRAERMFGAWFVKTTPDPIPSGQGATGIWHDAATNTVELHGADDRSTELWPGWSQANGLGRLRLQLGLNGLGGGDVLRFTPADPNVAPFNLGFSDPANMNDPQNDWLYTLGWNCGTTGSILKGQPDLCWTVESHYLVGNGFPAQVEAYFNFASGSGQDTASGRYINFHGQVGPPYLQSLALNANSVAIGGGPGPFGGQTQLVVTDTQAVLQSPDRLSQVSVDDVTGLVLGDHHGATDTRVAFLPNGRVQMEADLVPDGDNLRHLGHSDGNVALTRQFADGSFAVGVYLGNPNVSTQPPCDNTHEGLLQTVHSAPGVRTRTFQCMRSDSGVYSWRLLLDGGA